MILHGQILWQIYNANSVCIDYIWNGNDILVLTGKQVIWMTLTTTVCWRIGFLEKNICAMLFVPRASILEILSNLIVLCHKFILLYTKTFTFTLLEFNYFYGIPMNLTKSNNIFVLFPEFSWKLQTHYFASNFVKTSSLWTHWCQILQMKWNYCIHTCSICGKF